MSGPTPPLPGGGWDIHHQESNQHMGLTIRDFFFARGCVMKIVKMVLDEGVV